MANDIKTKRIIELFGEENLDKVSLFRIEHQSGFPSSQYNPDFWLSTTMTHDQVMYVLTYISYRLHKLNGNERNHISFNMKILKEIFYKCYGCAGYIPDINNPYRYNKDEHIDVSMAEYEAWILWKNNKDFPVNPDYPKELTEKDLEIYLRKMT